MISLKPIAKGQEIFNDYGQLPRSDLLRRYGYITDNYKKWDVVEIDAETVIEVAGACNELTESQIEARVSLLILLSDTILRFTSFKLLRDGTYLIMGTTCKANQAVRLSNSSQPSYL